MISNILHDVLVLSCFFSSFETRELEEKYFDAVDLIETAFNVLAENAVSKDLLMWSNLTKFRRRGSKIRN